MTSTNHIEVDDKQARILLRGIQEHGANLSRPMAVISHKLTNSVRENFRAGGRFSTVGSILGGSNTWEKAKTPPVFKRNDKRSGIKKGDEKGSTLLRSSRLMRSILPEHTSNEALAATNVEYAAIHNFGGKTKAHPITARKAKVLAFMSGGDSVFRRTVQHPGSDIPARPYLVIQEADIQDAEEVIVTHLLRRGGGGVR